MSIAILKNTVFFLNSVKYILSMIVVPRLRLLSSFMPRFLFCISSNRNAAHIYI